MVKPVMLIGLIGLLIALSNAMENMEIAIEAMEIKKSTFVNDVENVKQAIGTFVAFEHNIGVGSLRPNEFSCPFESPVFCNASGQIGCVADFDLKICDENNRMAKVIAEESEDKYFDDSEVHCMKLEGSELQKSDVHQGLVYALRDLNDIRPIDDTNPWCEVILLNNDTEEKKQTKYSTVIPDPLSPEKFDHARESLAVFKEKKKVVLMGFMDPKKVTYNIQCYGNSSSYLNKKKDHGVGKKMGIAFVLVLLVGTTVFLIWYFAIKEDAENNEGTYDEEEQTARHNIKEKDAVINVQDIKNKNAAAETNQEPNTA